MGWNPFKWVADIVEDVIDAVSDIVNTVVDAVASVFSAVGSAIAGLFGGLTPDVNIPTPNTSASPDGVLVTKTGSNVDIPIVYGYRRVGGRIVFAETNGTDNAFLYVIYAICEGEIEGVKQIRIDDNELPTPSGGKYTSGQQYTITQGRYANRLRVQIFNGSETQGQSSLANGSKSWPNATRKLPGVAYAVMQYEWKKIESQEDADNNPYRGGIPSVKFDVEGKKVYNVINHSGGADLASDYADLPKTFSYNPVSCTLDYLMNTRYGAGLDKSEIDADAFKTAAIKCNQQVSYSSGQTGKAITMNAVVSVQPKIIENVKMLLSGCRAFLPYIQGRYKIKIEDGGNATDITSSTLTSAFDVTTDHIVGTATMQGEQKANKFNQVIIRYVDPDKDFTEQQQVYTVASDVTADGEDLIGDFQFFTISNPNMAQDIARMIYEKSRQQRTINFNATPELLAVEPGDIIRVTSSILNLSNQTFRVVNMNFSVDGYVDLTCREHDATLYPFVSGDQIEIPSQVYKPDYYVLNPVSGSKPQTPISVAPPDDPEDVITDPTLDSVGAPTSTTSSSTVNDTLPQTPDLNEDTTITRFATVPKGQEYQQSLLGTIAGSSSALLYTIERAGLFMPFSGLPSPGGQMTLKMLTPQAAGVDKVRFHLFDRSTKVLKETQTASLSREEGQVEVPVFLQRLDTNTYVRPKFYNSQLDQEYNDGSAPQGVAQEGFVDTPTYSSFEYTNLEGNTVSGFNIEAALNNFIQRDTKFTLFNRQVSLEEIINLQREILGGF
jgi:hypothetical protein